MADEERANFGRLYNADRCFHSASATRQANDERSIVEGLARQTGRAQFDAYHPALVGLLNERLGALDHELLVMVSLDAQRAYICDDIVTVGGTRQLHGRYRLLVQKALDNGAASLLLAHNHPSGNWRPSRADIGFTRALKVLANALDIELIDHLVVARSSTFSIKLGRRV